MRRMKTESLLFRGVDLEPAVYELENWKEYKKLIFTYGDIFETYGGKKTYTVILYVEDVIFAINEERGLLINLDVDDDNKVAHVDAFDLNESMKLYIVDNHNFSLIVRGVK